MLTKMGSAAEPTVPRASTYALPDRITLLALAVSVLLGGANAVAVRFSNRELPPFWGAAARFAFAGLIFWVMVLAQRIRLPRGRALLGAVLYGLFSFGLSYAFLYWGLVKVQAGLTQVIIALVPLLTFFFAFAHGLEVFRWRGLVGAVISVGGIAIAFSGQLGGPAPFVSLLALVAGSACIAEGGVVVKLFPRSNPVVANAIGMTVGTGVLLIISAVAGETWTIPRLLETWIAYLYLVVIGSVLIFALFLFMLGRWTASATSYMYVLLPFVAVVISALLTGEAITPLLILGGALVLVGVWVGALTKPRQVKSSLPVPLATHE